MKRLRAVIAAIALGGGAVNAPMALAADARAEDAVDLFMDACVQDTFKLTPRIADPSKFSSARMPERFVGMFSQVTDYNKEIVHMLESSKRGLPIWQFEFMRSRAKIWTFLGSGRGCMVVVSNADEADVQAAFQRGIQRAATEGRAVLTPRDGSVSRRKSVAERSWELKSDKAKVVLSIWTSQNIGTQHAMSLIPLP